jgi:hypothetical protein
MIRPRTPVLTNSGLAGNHLPAGQCAFVESQPAIWSLLIGFVPIRAALEAAIVALIIVLRGTTPSDRASMPSTV